jgi:hypothetical protein
MDSCPTCRRKFVAAKSTDKKLEQDKLRAITALGKLQLWHPEGTDSVATKEAMRDAVDAEALRLARAINGDYGLLWRIYRRKDKGVPYGMFAAHDILATSEAA